MLRYFSLFALFSVIGCAQSADEDLRAAWRTLSEFDLATADSLGAKLLAQWPTSPAVHTFLGDLRLTEGQVGEAEKELKTAIKLEENFAPAWYGLSQVFETASLHHRAELALIQAVQYAPNVESYANALAALRRQREHPDKMRIVGGYAASEITLTPIATDAKHFRAFAIPVSINGGKPLKLILDTGAGGILLRSKAAERAGLAKIADAKVGGIGDKGNRDAWVAEADRVEAGGVTFSNYRIEVADKDALADDDGLIGSDVFGDFLITLDFFRRKLILTPRPGGVPDHSRTYDRTVTAGFSPVFLRGHNLLIETKVNDAGPFLFLIDTGSNRSMIAKDVAKAATKVHSDDYMTMKGLSGKVKDVYSADELTLQFANFRQKNLDMVTFDLDGISRGDGIRIGGILGLPVLVLFKTVTIDYLNGLVAFEYKH